MCHLCKQTQLWYSELGLATEAIGKYLIAHLPVILFMIVNKNKSHNGSSVAQLIDH